MIQKPRFRGHLHADFSAPEGIALCHETGSFRLEGTLLRRIAGLLDGRRTADEIATILEGDVSPVDVAFGLAWLEERGYIVEGAGDLPPAVGAFAEALGLDPAEAGRRLRERLVKLVRVGEAPIAPLEESLRELGVSSSETGDLTVVVTGDYLHEDLAALHPRMETPWLPVKPVGTQLWIGPLFTPGRRGCWLCLAERLRSWRRLWGHPPGLEVPRPAVDATVRTGLGLAATEILKWVLQGESPALEGTLTTFDVRTLESARHAVLPIPRCPACGEGAREARLPPAPPALSSRPKAALTPDGRTATPDEILRRYGPLVSPVTGIVDRLTPSHESNDLMVVYTAGYAPPAGGRRDGPRRTPEALRSAGRGTTPVQARAATLCEALERYSGFFQGNEPRVEASCRGLSGAVPPNDCLLISGAQLAGREDWNRRDLPYHWLPAPLDEERPIEWSPAWSLTAADWRWLPTAYCFYDYPPPAGPLFCRADSNGCAAGGCLEEAILQGFLEIVERDALAIWWYNRARRPGVRLEGLRHPYVAALRESFARLGREVWVLDITTDLGIPSFVALSREVPARPGDLILGAGSHLDPAVAIARALTELNQFLPGFLAGRPNRVLSEEPVDGEAYLLPGSLLDAGDLPILSRPDLREEVELCVERARDRGLEVLVVDQTREEIGLPVVRVVVPGMRLFRARFAPGRLYDVPVALGWRDAPLREEDLNPVHILI